MSSLFANRWSAAQIGFALALLVAACDHSDQLAPQAGIVSLSPALTETLYALDLGEQLIGRSDYGQYPPAVLELPAMGTALTPNFEAIARARPAVVVTDASGGDQVESLSRIAEVITLPWLRLADVTAGIRELGARFERQQQAERLAARMEAVLSRDPPEDGPRVLLALDGDDLSQVWFIRRNSLHGRALAAAGGRNAVERDVSGAAVLAPEALLASDPDIVVVLARSGDQATARERALARFAGLAQLSAVRERRVGSVTGDHLMVPGPSILALAEALEAEIDRLWR